MQNVSGQIRRDPRWSGFRTRGGARQRAFDQQHDALGIVGRLGIPKPLQLVLNQPMQLGTVSAGDGMCGVLGILQSEVSAEVPATAKTLHRYGSLEMIEDGQDPLSRVWPGTGHRCAIRVEIPGCGATQHLCEELVLTPEVLVERTSGDVRLFQQRGDPHTRPFAVGEALGRLEKALSRASLRGFDHPLSMPHLHE